MSFGRSIFMSRVFLSHRKSGDLFNVVPRHLRRCLSTAPAVESSKPPKWDLMSSVCVERKPVITSDLTEMEEKMQQFLNKLEFENSVKSDHELRREKDTAMLQALKSGNVTEADLEQATKATAQDFEDASLEELTKFKLASRENSKADKDMKSLDRHLSSHLILLVKQKLGDQEHWLLPEITRADGETMRQAAERALAETAGPNLDVTILGNAPFGFYKFKYPKEVRDKKGVEGAKIFFFKALYRGGEVKSKDHVWVTKEELEKKVKEKYFKSVDQFLMY